MTSRKHQCSTGPGHWAILTVCTLPGKLYPVSMVQLTHTAMDAELLSPIQCSHLLNMLQKFDIT